MHGNHAHDNAGGVLVFDLPQAPKRNGGHVRVFDNVCRDDNHENFAPPGNIVATVPSGTGVMVSIASRSRSRSSAVTFPTSAGRGSRPSRPGVVVSTGLGVDWGRAANPGALPSISNPRKPRG